MSSSYSMHKKDQGCVLLSQGCVSRHVIFAHAVLFGLAKLRKVFVWKELRNSTDKSNFNTQGCNKLPMVQVTDEIALHGMCL